MVAFCCFCFGLVGTSQALAADYTIHTIGVDESAQLVDGTSFTENLNGVKFDVENVATSQIFSVTTDTDGLASILSLPDGVYKVTERYPLTPDVDYAGYRIPKVRTHYISVNGNQIGTSMDQAGPFTLLTGNDQIEHVRLQNFVMLKQFSVAPGGVLTPLAGVTYELYRYPQGTTADTDFQNVPVSDLEKLVAPSWPPMTSDGGGIIFLDNINTAAYSTGDTYFALKQTDSTTGSVPTDHLYQVFKFEVDDRYHEGYRIFFVDIDGHGRWGYDGNHPSVLKETIHAINTTDVVDIEATKVWNNVDADTTVPTVWFKLYRSVGGGVPVEVPTTIAAIQALPAGTTTVSWSDLPQYDAGGNEYTYSVNEVDVTGLNENFVPDGYTKVENGLSVTNTKKEASVKDVKGTKVWIGGPEKKPDIQLQLMQNGKGYGNPVTLESGMTEYTWTNLPIYDNAGTTYTYTVTEVNVPKGYEKVENGLTVTNTYKPGDVENIKPNTPDTGDSSPLIMAYVLGATGLLTLAFFVRRKRVK